MVAFNDRRSVSLSHPTEAPGLSSGSGAFLSRKVVNDVFVVRSVPHSEQGREYAVWETLPSGETLLRSDGHPTRYSAQKAAKGMGPSNVREL